MVVKKRVAKEPAWDPELTPRSELAAMRERLNAELGGGLFFGSDTQLELRRLPVGMPALDGFLGGGFAFNRLTLLYGEFSTGKTVIALLAARAAQAAGLSVAWIDAEKSWTAEWAKQLNVNPSEIIITQPSSGEEGFEQALAFVKAKIGLLVIDSLVALRSKSEWDNKPGENFDSSPMGNHAKLIGRGLMDLMAVNAGTCLVAINQVREKVGIAYGNPTTLPGGKGQHFVASQEIRVSRGEWLPSAAKKGTPRTGYRMRLAMEKNKLGRPFTSLEIPFYFTGEFDELSSLIDMAIELGLILSKPPMFYLGEQKFFGRGKLQETVKADPNLQALLVKLIDELPELDI